MLASWNGDIHNQASPFNTKHVLHCVHKMFTQGTHLHDAKKIFDFSLAFFFIFFLKPGSYQCQM